VVPPDATFSIDEDARVVHIPKCPRCGDPHDLPLPESRADLMLGKETVYLTCPKENEEFKITFEVED
jgi:hypothetical protein